MFRLFLFFLFARMLFLALPACAGSFSIDPVRIRLSEAQTSAVMRVENRGDAAITVQLQAMSWSQSDNRDQLAISRELLATPQVFRLRPGQVQVVRVALLRPVDAKRELSYRLLLDEVPPAPAKDFRGLQMALRISMPVFVQPREAAVGNLVATVIDRNGQRQLRLSNPGLAHLQLTGLSLQSLPSAAISSPPDLHIEPSALALATERLLPVHGKTLYLLPGQQRELALPDQTSFAQGRLIRLRAQTEFGAQEWPVPVAGP